ncbi:molecular chaperone Hsp33 [Rhodothalassium salexigens DSM 2132]|uniref:Molecular chaperone Hsp33 n=1 Tax=Rhodothalassium salexigens DSM 2132 TaxID=1188247 RepID=A0A4R2PKV9_RHOSA|nr:Hsp33 family molecular chaperone HslO [Rhodothalassium salexigens]MBB4211144.1 molecular chaperone Hsp33 [Rhodothalassium salexigens DSM 2132]MBK1637485.1 hypothetical protein [Rhodothalassium salexigens DSM 2132]TCP36200.1 molecular chaperone Hsp33 [Rhodothalassium salexigens DSM 2132]
MTDEPIVVPDPPGSADNQVLPFRIEGQPVRGRAVRLGTAADRIIRAHDYPAPVAGVVGELAALSCLLGSMLKVDDGILTIQAKGSGPLSLLVGDFLAPGTVRGFAQVDRDRLKTLGKRPSLQGLMGKGHLALTLDQGPQTDRYQGIVALEGGTLAECAGTYFAQSEQLPTRILLHAGQDPVSGHWRAGGIMVQDLPTGGGTPDDGGGDIDHDAAGEPNTEPFNRATALMMSTRAEELLDPELALPTLLFRLFHEDGVRVFDSHPVAFGCRCSRDKIASVLARYSSEELSDMVEDDGLITVTCQFCNTDYRFEP